MREGRGLLIGRPRNSRSPLSSLKNPEITLMRVDLPDPLGPIRPTISPGSTDRSTAESAWIPPKLLDTCEHRSTDLPSGAVESQPKLLKRVPNHSSAEENRQKHQESQYS